MREKQPPEVNDTNEAEKDAGKPQSNSL